MENGTKLRILYLYQHLVQHTDAEHTLSTAELMKILKEEYSVSVSRNTISDDLAMLHDCGLHIAHYESTQNKYYADAPPNKTLGVIQVDESVWKKLTREEKQEIERICDEKLEQYYSRFS